MKPIDTIYLVGFATLIALGILFYFFTNKKKSLWVMVGRYSSLVWVTDTIVRIVLKYIYKFYFSSWYASLEKNYQLYIYLEWKWDRQMEYVASMIILLPLFIVFCWFLFYSTKNSRVLKSTLSILVIFYGIIMILPYGDFSSEYRTEAALFFAVRIISFLSCIWIFKINIKNVDISKK